MHFMASPATFYRRPMNEFSSPNTFPALLQFIAQCHSRIECGTSTVALEDVHQRRRSRVIATQQIRFPLNSVPATALLCSAACICSLRRSQRRVLISNAALAETVRGDEQWTYS